MFHHRQQTAPADRPLLSHSEEWFQRMPEARLDPDHPPLTEAGPVSKITRLDLLWGA